MGSLAAERHQVALDAEGAEYDSEREIMLSSTGPCSMCSSR